MTDGGQSVTLQNFSKIMKEIKAVANAVEREA